MAAVPASPDAAAEEPTTAAPKKPSKPSTEWGGLLEGETGLVALSDTGGACITDTEHSVFGAVKADCHMQSSRTGPLPRASASQVMQLMTASGCLQHAQTPSPQNFVYCTAGTVWLQQMRGKTVADYKVNKTFRNARDKASVKRQLNPLFLVVQVAALTSMVSSVMKALLLVDPDL